MNLQVISYASFLFRAWQIIYKLVYNSFKVIDVFHNIIITISVSKCFISSELVKFRIFDFHLAPGLY